MLEHLEGETLAQRLAREPRGLKLAEALRIAVAGADALDAAHRHGFVHRDLKPVGSAPPAFTFLLNWRPDCVERVQ